MRPYNSLPRGQDASGYPSLAARHQARPEKGATEEGRKNATPRHSPARRAHSEDVYAERRSEGTQTVAVAEVERVGEAQEGRGCVL